jgi:poly-gamma-glutamate synthesis protein (capsule biosynthesis protein)
MSVRDPGFDPRRRRRPRDGAHPLTPEASRPAWLLPAVLIGTLAVAVLAVGAGVFAFGTGGSPAASPSAIAEVPSASTAVESPSDAASPSEPGGSAEPSPSTEPSGSPEPAPLVDGEVAIAPVVAFRSTRTAARPAEVRSLAEGDDVFDRLVLVEDDADGILEALRLNRDDLGDRLRTVGSAEALARTLSRNRQAIGFLRADQVAPSVRAIGWGSAELFGNQRVKSLDAWPLTATLQVPEGQAPAYDPGDAWTLVAGGDVLLDRGVKLAIDDHASGTDFPFNGGTVDITGRCRDCSPFGWDTPYTDRTGNAGVVRKLTRGADITIANFENPAPDDWRFHAAGTVFSADPDNIAVLADAGFDWVSMANNHIGDAGDDGILETMDNLDDHGIAHAGAGRNTKQAHRAALLEAGGVTVGLLGYDTIAPTYWSTPDSPGSAHMTKKALRQDIRAARKAGADVVVVMPHWGVEYTAKPTAQQQKLGRAAIDAGADMVIGNHPHWVGAMEVYKGRPIWYALGNLVFDQTWSIPTEQGITLELTMAGDRLVQARMRPHLILDKAQPNFLDPAGDGRAVLNQVYRASGQLLPW